MAKAKRPIAEVLMEAGVDGITAQSIESIVLEFDLDDNPTDEQLAAMEGAFDPEAAIRDARAAWWSGEHIPFEYKRLLDAKVDTPMPEEQRGVITVNILEQWDASMGKFIAKGHLLSPAALNTLERYYDHAKAIDSGPPRPEFTTIDDVAKFYRANSSSHNSSIAIQLVWSYLNIVDEETVKGLKRDISHVQRDEHGRWIDTPGVGDDAPKEARNFTRSPADTATLSEVEFREFVSNDILRTGGSGDVMPHYLAWVKHEPGRKWSMISSVNDINSEQREFDILLKNHGINNLSRYGIWLRDNDLVENKAIDSFIKRGAVRAFGEDQSFEEISSFLNTSGASLWWLDHEQVGNAIEGRTMEEAYSLLTGPGDDGEINFTGKLGQQYMETVLDNVAPMDESMQIQAAIERDFLNFGKEPHPATAEGWRTFTGTGIDNETGELVDLPGGDAAGYEAIKTEEYYGANDRADKKHGVVTGLMDTEMELGRVEMGFSSNVSAVPAEYHQVNQYVKTWAKTSNDNDMRALGLQETAAEHFGVGMSEWQQGKIAEVKARFEAGETNIEDYNHQVKGQNPSKNRYLFQDEGTADFDPDAVQSAKSDLKHYIDKTYRSTQEYLKARGITEVRLFRGTTTGVDNPGVEPGDLVKYTDNALSSWSVDWGTAAGFARPLSQAKYGTVMSTVVPVERIFSTAHTGPGCLQEGEAIVIANPGPSYARIDYVTNLPSQALWEQMQENLSFKAAPKDISHVWRDEKGRWTNTPGIGDDAPKAPQKPKGDEVSSPIEPLPAHIAEMGESAMFNALERREVNWAQYEQWNKLNKWGMPPTGIGQRRLVQLFHDTGPEGATFMDALNKGVEINKDMAPGAWIEESLKLFPETSAIENIPPYVLSEIDLSELYAETVAGWIKADAATREPERDLRKVLDRFYDEFEGAADSHKSNGYVVFEILDWDSENEYDMSLADFSATTVFDAKSHKMGFNAMFNQIVTDDKTINGDFGKVMDTIEANRAGGLSGIDMRVVSLAMLHDGIYQDTPITHLPVEWAIEIASTPSAMRSHGDTATLSQLDEALGNATFFDAEKWANEINVGRGGNRNKLREADWLAMEANTVDLDKPGVLDRLFLAPRGGRTELGKAIQHDDFVTSAYWRGRGSDIELDEYMKMSSEYGNPVMGSLFVKHLRDTGKLGKGDWPKVSAAMEANNLPWNKSKMDLRRMIEVTGLEDMSDKDIYRMELSGVFDQATISEGDFQQISKVRSTMPYIQPDMETGEIIHGTEDQFENLLVAQSPMRGYSPSAANRNLGPTEAQKDAIVSRLSINTELDYYDADQFIKQWAMSSNGGDMRSLGIQEVAAETFDTDLSDWQKTEVEVAKEFGKGKYLLQPMGGSEDDAKLRIGRALEDIKDDTEKFFKQNFPDKPDMKILLYRGVKFPTGTVIADQGLLDVVEFDDNALSSWTTDRDTARRFAAGGNQSTTEGVVLASYVPIDRVLCNYRTGFGCLSEKEYVVIGSPDKQYATVEWLRPSE